MVDGSDTEEITGSESDEDDDDGYESNITNDEVDEELVLENIGSELSEEEYDYSDDEK